ncbi:MAG: EamA family transporter, partial [Nitrospinaceae bacterium]
MTGLTVETNKPKTPNAFLAGIGFTAVTTVLWGMLPILMEIALGGFTSGTIVCFRFFFAFFVLLGILKFRREAPERLLLRPPWLGLVAGGLLAGTYYY